MTLLDAARQALEALEESNKNIHLQDCYHAFDGEITDLRQAIEQAEQQEPVGEIVQGFADLVAVSIPVMPPVGTKLYTIQPKRKPAPVRSAEEASTFIDALLCEAIDMQVAWPEAQPDPSIWGLLRPIHRSQARD